MNAWKPKGEAYELHGTRDYQPHFGLRELLALIFLVATNPFILFPVVLIFGFYKIMEMLAR